LARQYHEFLFLSEKIPKPIRSRPFHNTDLPILQSTSFDTLFHQYASLTLCVPTSRLYIGIEILINSPSSTPLGLDLGPD